MYHEGNRELQARFGSVALADRLLEKTHRTAFTDGDKAFIESLPFFFLATADAEGQPDCSFKGGAPGFVKVLAPDLLVYPDYDGNGMFKSLGNIRSNAACRPPVHRDDRAGRKRLRVLGHGGARRSMIRCSRTFPAASCWCASGRPTSSRTARATSPTCSSTQPSVYVPDAGCTPVEPDMEGLSRLQGRRSAAQTHRMS